ncbi:aromatic amino acid lyase [Deltaproteobacteria bacterium Smac51]|nr:aromatic amino acid lyase [Deltaproteobacteria bacterium Smac51]
MKIVLTGRDLGLEQLALIAEEKAAVEIAPEAIERLKASRKLVYDLVESDVPVYGFNTGVGWNKDRHIAADFFKEYNENLIHSHSLGVKPEASEAEVRAAMAVRLNCLLNGNTGIEPSIALRYADFLNLEIHPVIPERGSVGVGDITTLSHVGLAMIGEGEVNYQGRRMSAAEAHKLAGIEPVTLGPKDGLAIVSSNAFAMGQGGLVLHDLCRMADLADLVYAVSLTGYNGNTSPLDPRVHELKGLEGQKHSAALASSFLEDSYIYAPDPAKPVQDPLSYRSGVYLNGTLRDALSFVNGYARIQMNTSDDNPCLLLEDRAMISCSNFEASTVTVGFEMLAIALSHVSKMSCQRIIRIVNPELTGLPRFLTPDEGLVHAFGTAQKVFTSLDTEIRHLSNPSSADFMPLAGSIEDHANNFTHVVQRVRKIADNLKYIFSLELMHACQAITLRLQREPELRLSRPVRGAYDHYRQFIPWYDRDRPISPDIEKGYQLLKNGSILAAALEYLAR